MNGFALDTNIVSAHLRGDANVGIQIRANTQPEFRSSRGRRRYHAWLRKTLAIAAAVSN
jgi:predicted nucleic acid-binding protein